MIRFAIRSVIQSDPIWSNPDFVDADACVTGQKTSCVFAGLTVFLKIFFFMKTYERYQVLSYARIEVYCKNFLKYLNILVKYFIVI